MNRKIHPHSFFKFVNFKQRVIICALFFITKAAKRQNIFILDGLAMLGFSPRTLTLAIDTINLINKHE